MADSLRFNVAQLLRDTVGAARYLQIDVSLDELAPELQQASGAAQQPAGRLRGPLKLILTNAGVLVQGRFEAEATLSCSRCLEPVSVPLSFEIAEVFTPTLDIVTGKSVVPDEEDQALWIDEHHVLDLTEVLRQELLVNVPLQVKCREDCLGLCPKCGKNLNEGPCDCKPEPDPRWSALTDLLREDV